jgi:murein DD-endopeptidase MepM/ murein hydrolase activator NlpD
MKPAIRNVFLLLLTGILSACGSLWGAEATPTDAPSVFWTINPNTPLPFATFTPVIVSPTPYPTDTPVPTDTPAGSPTPVVPRVMYYTQEGDTLPAVAAHFSAAPAEIGGPPDLSQTGLLVPETPLFIPDRLGSMRLTPGRQIMPDSEIVYSPTAIDFNTETYVTGQNGYLNRYQQYLSATGWTSGAQAVQRIAIENSVNPRLLLALIEYESGWVSGQPGNLAQTDYPLGYIDFQYRQLYMQMMWAVQELATGYYGWRSGALTEITLTDGSNLRLSPDLNAGTVALQYFFARRYGYKDWLNAIDPAAGFPELYTRMFGDPYTRDYMLFPPSLAQPAFILPFEVGKVWSFTGGPHSAWGFNRDETMAKKGALAALDFAPAADTTGCYDSDAWVLASASGRVVRSGNGVVVLDLGDDGYEQTGWDLLYMHIADRDRAKTGAWLQTGDHVGHPSCTGGDSTGTHVHFARKFNGEWVLADGPLPFTLSGWVAHAGSEPYHGTLTKGDQVVTSNQNGTFISQIVRTPGE